MSVFAGLRRWLFEATRTLTALGFGGRREPRVPAPPEGLEVERPADVERRPERHTEIPDEQHRGGGPPHR